MDTKFEVGDIVLSRSGHDKNRAFLVISIDKNGYLGIIDGRFRKSNQPKRKNPKHIQKFGHSDEIIKKFNSNDFTETEIYKMIKNFVRSENV